MKIYGVEKFLIGCSAIGILLSLINNDKLFLSLNVAGAGLVIDTIYNGRRGEEAYFMRPFRGLYSRIKGVPYNPKF